MDADSTRIGSHRMLAELDFATGLRTPIIHAFGSAADELARFVEGARRRPDAKSGHQVFAIFHLITRGLTDLIAGAHLLNHCYTVQAYSVMRPALEACDLIELFAADDGEVSTWVMTEEGHKHFMPGQVRKRLGQKGHDPVHSHFSESGGHPRFAGARLSGGMRVATDDPNDRTAILCIGPMWPEHPSVLFGWAARLQRAEPARVQGAAPGDRGDHHGRRMARHLRGAARPPPRLCGTRGGRAR